MTSDDDTRPVLTPTLERRVGAIESELGELPIGARARLARLLVQWRAEDYDAGRRGAAQSQSMPAVKLPT
jgi:hypothetical protein